MTIVDDEYDAIIAGTSKFAGAKHSPRASIQPKKAKKAKKNEHSKPHHRSRTC